MALERGRCGFLGILMKLSFVFVCWLEQSLWRLNEHVVLHKVLQTRQRKRPGSVRRLARGGRQLWKPRTWQWTNLWLTNPCPGKKTSSVTGVVKGSWYTRSASSKRCYYYCYHCITFHWIVCVPERTCFFKWVSILPRTRFQRKQNTKPFKVWLDFIPHTII